MANGFFQQKLPKKGLNRKSERHYQILHIENTLGTKFQLKLTFLNFLIKLIQKGISDLKNENHHQILHMSLNTQFWFLEKQFSQTRIALNENRKSKHHHRILYICNSLSIKFHFEQFWILERIWSKKTFLVEIRKRVHHHWILHIWIRLGTKFQLQ